MNRKTPITIARWGLTLCCALGGACVAAAAPKALLSPLDLGRATAKDSEAFDLLIELTSKIGPRMSATERGAAAETFVFEKLRAFGIRDVRFEPFQMVSWSRGSVEVTIEGKSIPAAAMVYSPSHADLSTEIVEVGNGASSDYAADYDKVRGKIALIYMGMLPESPSGTSYLPRWEKLALAVGHGALGVIFINPAAGNHLVTGTAGGSARVVTVPVAAVGHDDGLALRTEIRGGHPMHATMRLTNTVGPGVARNVIATIPGTERPNEVIVLGAHLDSLDLATGAVDNGSGAMWVLDVARAFATHNVRPHRTVQFIFFMGEEEGLLGSYTHVRRAVKNNSMSHVWYMINTDMSINPDGLRLWGGNPDMKFFEGFAAQVREIYPSFNNISTAMADLSQKTDSQPFIEHGVPIIYPMAQWPEGLMACIHTDCDDIHWLDDRQMRRSAVVGAMLVFALGNAPDSVARVFSLSETAAYFKEANVTRGYLGPADTD